eukprot:1157222-Pelagomonas_calceolata.AAC.6
MKVLLALVVVVVTAGLCESVAQRSETARLRNALTAHGSRARGCHGSGWGRLGSPPNGTHVPQGRAAAACEAGCARDLASYTAASILVLYAEATVASHMLKLDSNHTSHYADYSVGVSAPRAHHSGMFQIGALYMQHAPAGWSWADNKAACH